MRKRIEAYAYITEIFGFVCNILTMSENEVKIKANNFVEIYHKDLEIELHNLRTRAAYSNDEIAAASVFFSSSKRKK